MEYLGLVDGPEVATEEPKPKPKPISRVDEKTSTPTNGVTVIGGRGVVGSELVSELEPSYNIVTLHPRSYSEARQMAEHYRHG